MSQQVIDPEALKSDLREKIDLGQELLEKLSDVNLKNVQGIAKLEKKVRQEVKFLEKFLVTGQLSKLKKEHLQCSNLVHLESIIVELCKVYKPQAVMQVFNLCNKDGDVSKKVVVDIVGKDGHTWIKVVARNPRALDLNSQGGNQYGQKSIMDQVKEFVKCSRQNPTMFKTPVVKFVFANGITSSLDRKIRSKGAAVDGVIVNIEEVDEDSDEESDSDDEESDDDDDEWTEPEFDENVDTTRLNLDITAMIAYVSALTNEDKKLRFNEKILNDQAEWERRRPVKPVLENLFKEKELIACESAMRDFKTIVATLGGEGEKKRTEDLCRQVVVVPDQISHRLQQLHLTGKIKDRSRAIFGTGDSLRVITITANSGFVRACKGRGVSLAVITHESRALSEDKEKFALPDTN